MRAAHPGPDNPGVAAPEHRGTVIVAVVPVVRLFGFRPTRPAFDNAVRDWIAPALRSRPGFIDVYAGRHGPDELGPRLVISIWESGEAMDRVFAAPASTDGFHPEQLDGITDVAVDVLLPEVAYRADRPAAPPRIIRVLRGCTQPGQRTRYIEQTRSGVAADVAAGHGPTAFYLAGGDAPEAFVAVSVWTGWPSIEVATGGDVRRPTATRRPELIEAFDATHFEAIDL